MKESLVDKFYQPVFKSKISQIGQFESKYLPNKQFQANFIFENNGESYWPEDI